MSSSTAASGPDVQHKHFDTPPEGPGSPATGSHHFDENPQPLVQQSHGFDDEGSNASRVPSRQISRTQSRTSEFLNRTVTGLRPFNGVNGVPSMGGGRDYPPLLGDREPYKVTFDGPKDPDNALNWPIGSKMKCAVPLSLAAICSTWSSAVYAPAIPEVSKVFHVGTVPATLGVSLYVFGFASGPVVWGPISEIFGRKMPLSIAYLMFVCFAFASATAKDMQTLMICRFFSGATGAAPLVLVVASFSDLFEAAQRGSAVILFTMFVIGGPLLAPVIAGYVVDSYLGWRWTLYLSGIFGALTLVIILVFLDETFAPIILSRRARAIRDATGNWGVYADQDLIEFDLRDIIHRTISKPFRMLSVEPILLLLSLYHGYIYGLLYLLLEAVPIVFQAYHFKGGNVQLPYLALFCGTTAAACTAIFVFEPIFLKTLKKSGKPVLPEARLPLMMFGSPLFTLGIFWFGWTGGYPEHVHWLAPVFGLGLFGFGFLCVFVTPFNYIVDSYLMLTASAMAANAFVRGSMGAAFPLFTKAMYTNLTVKWAGTLIGCLSAILLPVPFLFYKYGAWIRAKSKYAINLEAGGPPGGGRGGPPGGGPGGPPGGGPGGPPGGGPGSGPDEAKNTKSE